MIFKHKVLCFGLVFMMMYLVLNNGTATYVQNNPVSALSGKTLVSSEEFFVDEVQKEALIETDLECSAWVIETTWLKESYQDSAPDLYRILKYEEITVTGYTNVGYYRISYNDETFYIDEKAITLDENVILQMHEATYSKTWEGSKLSKRRGAIHGPNGRETYYNLDMTGVIMIMNRLGYEGTYWVREDGVKMFGDYIMCAADLDTFPRGSLVESSLGTCIVCDTGGFAADGNTKLDIAVNW